MNEEDEQIMNNNINLDENNYKEKPLSTDENILNENIITNNNEENDEGYMTNSDINDSKYLPKNNLPPNYDPNQLEDDNLNIDNYMVPTNNQMQLQSQIMNMENEKMLSEQNLEEIENEKVEFDETADIEYEGDAELAAELATESDTDD